MWLVNRVQIMQPGSFIHFHWITSDSTDPWSVDVSSVCDVHTACELDGSAENEICPDWFLQITALRSFAFQHGNEIVPVKKGIDNATHLNLITNYADISNITATRGDSGN